MANFSMVSADQIETFRRDGFLHIPGLVDEPAGALLRAAMDDLFGASDGDPGVNNVTAYAAKAKARGTTVLADRDGPAAGRFLIRQNTWFGDARIRDFGSQSPLPEVAAALMGADQLSFLGDHLFLKEPGSLYRTAFHQDSAYFHCIGEQCCSFWVSLDTVTRESGAMGYVPGSHRWGRDFNAESWVAHRAYWPGAEGEAVPAIEEDEAGWGVRYVETSPGDVIVHHYKTLHGATGNISATSIRRAATFRYLGPDMRYREQPVGNTHTPTKSTELREGDPMIGREYPVVWPSQAAVAAAVPR